MTPRELLTAKETQISSLVWQGMTNLEIAKTMPSNWCKT